MAPRIREMSLDGLSIGGDRLPSGSRFDSGWFQHRYFLCLKNRLRGRDEWTDVDIGGYRARSERSEYAARAPKEAIWKTSGTFSLKGSQVAWWRELTKLLVWAGLEGSIMTILDRKACSRNMTSMEINRHSLRIDKLLYSENLNFQKTKRCLDTRQFFPGEKKKVFALWCGVIEFSHQDYSPNKAKNISSHERTDIILHGVW